MDQGKHKGNKLENKIKYNKMKNLELNPYIEMLKDTVKTLGKRRNKRNTPTTELFANSDREYELMLHATARVFGRETTWAQETYNHELAHREEARRQHGKNLAQEVLGITISAEPKEDKATPFYLARYHPGHEPTTKQRIAIRLAPKNPSEEDVLEAKAYRIAA